MLRWIPSPEVPCAFSHDLPEILPLWLSTRMPRSGYVAAARPARRWLDRAFPERVRVELLDHGPLPVIDPVSNRIGDMVDEIAWDRPSRPRVRVRDVEAGGVERRTLCPIPGGLEVAQQPAAGTTTR